MRVMAGNAGHRFMRTGQKLVILLMMLDKTLFRRNLIGFSSYMTSSAQGSLLVKRNLCFG